MDGVFTACIRVIAIRSSPDVGQHVANIVEALQRGDQLTDKGVEFKYQITYTDGTISPFGLLQGEITGFRKIVDVGSRHAVYEIELHCLAEGNRYRVTFNTATGTGSVPI